MLNEQRHHRAAERIKKPRLVDIANALDISRATVSNAFNRPQIVADDLRGRILEYANAIGYFGPDPKARAMRMQALQEVAVVFHHDLSYALNDSQSVAFLRGVASELDIRGLSLQVIPNMGRSGGPWASAFQTTADALIVHDQLPSELLPQVRAMHKPVTLIDAAYEGVTCVSVDDRGGAEAAAHHALDRQLHDVIVLSLPMAEEEYRGIVSGDAQFVPWSISGRRLAGYCRVFKQRGFDLGAVHVVWCDDKQPEQLSPRLTALLEGLVKKGKSIGVLCMSDRLALAAQAKFAGQLTCLIGFDDIPEATIHGLTTIRQDSFSKGVLAVRVVLDRLKSERIATELVIRET